MNSSSKISNTISLEKFQHLCNLEDRKLIEMLELGSLPILIVEKGQILVDMESYSMEQMGSAILASLQRKPEIDPQVRRTIEETVSKEILQFLEPAIQEAIDIVQGWQNSKPTSSSKELSEKVPDPNRS